MDRRSALQAYMKKTEEALETMLKAAYHSRDSAISDEVKTQDKYDTQSTELAYLAGAQAERAAQLKESFGRLKTLEKNFQEKLEQIAETSIFSLENLRTKSRILYMLLPIEGGVKIELDGQELTSLSSTSPLGEELIGKTAGEEFEVEMNGRDFSYRVVDLLAQG